MASSGLIGLQRRQPFGGSGVAFVGDVVGAAREGVDRFDGRHQAARQQDRGDGEILVMIDGHALLDY
jgi:hypothetical protein